MDSGAKKLSEMYAQLNLRFATALMDLKWAERVAELELTAGYCCRPFQ